MHKFIQLKKRRNFLRKIITSNTEIKHTNNKIIVTLYVLNREKKLLKKKYLKMNNIINEKLIKQFYLLYIENLISMRNIFRYLKKKYTFFPRVIRKNIYIKAKIENLNKFKILKNIYLKKI